jgi:hypothetical protein
MSEDDDFFAICERYQRNRILQGGPQIDQERLRAVLKKLRDATERVSRISATPVRSKNISWCLTLAPSGAD